MSVKINGIEFGNELFPNNERIFKSLPWQICAHNFIRVDFKYETDFDIWKLIVAKKYLDDKFNDIRSYCHCGGKFNIVYCSSKEKRG